LCFKAGKAADFRCSGAGRVDWVKAINIKADIGRFITDDLSCFLHDFTPTARIELFHINHPHSRIVTEFPDIQVIDRPSDSDLHRSFGV